MESNDSLRWAGDVAGSSPSLSCVEDSPRRKSTKKALKRAPSEPYLTDEYQPTNPDLWEKCVEVVNGKRRELTQYGRTIHAPNDGRGYDHMPNPYGMAWAVKQYNGFGGNWKGKKEAASAHAHELRVMAHGGIVLAPRGRLDALKARGLVTLAGQGPSGDYWDITQKGRRIVLAGLVDELSRRMNGLLTDTAFDPLVAKELGLWILNNFRVDSPKTPSGGKAIKGRMLRLVWVLTNRHGQQKEPDGENIRAEIRRDWEEIEPSKALLLKFTDEGGTVVPKEWNHGGVLYINEAGASEVNLERYVKRLAGIFTSITGWRAKALSGQLKIVLKPASAFSGTATGKYKRVLDEMWVRTTPAVLKRAQGYASFEYILVHELGHRFERFKRLPTDFDHASWWTSQYSRDEGESFAELFALGHFDTRGNWDEKILDRFEAVMTGNEGS